ncbi:hypothetical protein [Nitrospira defluvii]|uniref:Uncharacterized protein n=1 Tax=Nitrospira defluvii TaxID=330214 RepID=A0ABM8RHE2_9BACT|nr:hypothetical protein [Nitrospira defluvii]CAE6753283.1 conserved hypothetical protein [Nitrospira defluvii]
MKPLIYRNWRGKSFVIDDTFVEDIKARLIAEGEDPSDWDYFTPEYLMKVLPTMEAHERCIQLEEAWSRL